MSQKIYCIENTITNKKYIGKTKFDIELRFIQHKNKSKSFRNKSYLYNAFLKHGEDNFIIYVIEDNIKDNDINSRERYWISELNTFTPNGYNLTKGGDGGDTSHSLIYKKNMSAWHQAQSKDFYATNGFKGKTHSDESLKKQSIARHTYWNNPDNIAKRKDTSGANNPSSKPLSINSVDYPSLATAAKALNYSEHFLRTQIKKQGSRNLVI